MLQVVVPRSAKEAALLAAIGVVCADHDLPGCHDEPHADEPSGEFEDLLLHPLERLIVLHADQVSTLDLGPDPHAIMSMSSAPMPRWDILSAPWLVMRTALLMSSAPRNRSKIHPIEVAEVHIRRGQFGTHPLGPLGGSAFRHLVQSDAAVDDSDSSLFIPADYLCCFVVTNSVGWRERSGALHRTEILVRVVGTANRIQRFVQEGREGVMLILIVVLAALTKKLWFANLRPKRSRASIDSSSTRKASASAP